MSIKDYIKHYGSANMPNDDINISGGTINLSDEITGVSIGEIFPSFSISETETKTWYYKSCIANTHTSSNAYLCKVWIWNGLISPSASGTVAIYSESSLDDSSYMVRIIGETSAGVETTEDVVLAGTTTVYSLASFSKIHRVELRSVISPYPLLGCNGNIHIIRGIELGIIPYDQETLTGYTGAVGNVSIALEIALNGSDQVSNRVTAPSGLTFTIPNTKVNAIPFANSGTLTHQYFQGIWWELSSESGEKSSENMPVLLRFSCQDVA